MASGLRVQLVLEADSLEPGDSTRVVCPFCGGGSSAERSLVLSKALDGALLFLCHRAHCGASGLLRGGSGGGRAVSERPVKAYPVLPEQHLIIDVALDALIYTRVLERWHFTNVPIHWKWHQGMNRLLFPVMSPTYTRRGWVARSFNTLPKTLNYKEKFDEPWAHWAETHGGNRVVIVEDIPSAERLVRGSFYSACALMGTHMSDDVADEVVAVAKKRPVIIALDRDALAKSIELRDKLRGRCPGKVGVWVLEKDIKDMTSEELTKWVNESY